MPYFVFRLVFQLGILRRVDNLNPHPTVARDFVLAPTESLHAGHQGRQQRMAFCSLK